MEVFLHADNFGNEHGTWLLEDCLSGTHKQAITAHFVVTPNNRLVARLINPTDSPVMLRRGTKIATLSQLPADSMSSHQPQEVFQRRSANSYGN